MKKIWTTPSGKVNELYEDMLQQPHLLIAGATGSGKSVAINGIISTALYHSPAKVGFILIDPKRCELSEYYNLPHTICHASGFNPDKWEKALSQAVAIMDQRYKQMERQRVKLYNGPDLYVIIDEFAIVYTSGGKSCYKSVLRLTSEGRAAKVHCIIATQVPKATILPTEVRGNIASKLCLRTDSKIQSRVIMEATGCELLPDYGYGYYIRPCKKDLCSIPMVTDAERERLINHWTTNKPKLRLFG